MDLPFPAVKITHGGRCRKEVSLTIDQPSAKWVIGFFLQTFQTVPMQCNAEKLWKPFRLFQCNARQKSCENLLDFQCKEFVATCMTATLYFCRSWNQQQKALNVLRHPDCLFPFQDIFLITWSSYHHANIISIDISIFTPWIFLYNQKPFQYFLCLEIFLMVSNSTVER